MRFFFERERKFFIMWVLKLTYEVTSSEGTTCTCKNNVLIHHNYMHIFRQKIMVFLKCHVIVIDINALITFNF